MDGALSQYDRYLQEIQTYPHLPRLKIILGNYIPLI